MTLDWNGREVILRRKAKGANPFGNVQAVDGATGELIPELCVDKPGEVLLGVEREVFERSAFVGQTAITVDGDPALEKRIAALLTAGQEEVSFSQVQRQLKDWRNRRQHNKTGLIPKLEGEMTEQEELLFRAARARRQEEEGMTDLEALRREKQLLEQEKAILKAKAEGEKWDRFRESAKDYLQAREEYEALAEQFRNLPSKEELIKAQQDYQQTQTLAAALRLKEDEIKRKAETPPEPVELSGINAGNIAVGILCAVVVAVIGLLLLLFIHSLDNGYLFGRRRGDQLFITNLIFLSHRGNNGLDQIRTPETGTPQSQHAGHGQGNTNQGIASPGRMTEKIFDTAELFALISRIRQSGSTGFDPFLRFMHFEHDHDTNESRESPYKVQTLPSPHRNDYT